MADCTFVPPRLRWSAPRSHRGLLHRGSIACRLRRDARRVRGHRDRGGARGPSPRFFAPTNDPATNGERLANADDA